MIIDISSCGDESDVFDSINFNLGGGKNLHWGHACSDANNTLLSRTNILLPVGPIYY